MDAAGLRLQLSAKARLNRTGVVISEWTLTSYSAAVGSAKGPDAAERWAEAVGQAPALAAGCKDAEVLAVAAGGAERAGGKLPLLHVTAQHGPLLEAWGGEATPSVAEGAATEGGDARACSGATRAATAPLPTAAVLAEGMTWTRTRRIARILSASFTDDESEGD